MYASVGAGNGDANAGDIAGARALYGASGAAATVANDDPSALSLAAATVEYGAQVGAHVLEGYPTEPPPGKTVIWDEASVGPLQVFVEAGYEVVASPTLRRRVVRRQFNQPTQAD